MAAVRAPGCALIGEDGAVVFLLGFDASPFPLLVKVALAVVGQTVPESLLRTSSADHQQSFLRLRRGRSSHG